jgi:hypothetical protein
VGAPRACPDTRRDSAASASDGAGPGPSLLLLQVQATGTGIMPVVGPAVRRGPRAGPALRCARPVCLRRRICTGRGGVPATETGSELSIATEKLEVTGPPGLSDSRSTKCGRPFLILSSSKRPFFLLCRLPPCILVPPCTCALQTRRTPGMSFAFGAYPGAVLWRLCATAR